jgi:hypothetical protein
MMTELKNKWNTVCAKSVDRWETWSSLLLISIHFFVSSLPFFSDGGIYVYLLVHITILLYLLGVT